MNEFLVAAQFVFLILAVGFMLRSLWLWFLETLEARWLKKYERNYTYLYKVIDSQNRALRDVLQRLKALEAKNKTTLFAKPREVFTNANLPV